MIRHFMAFVGKDSRVCAEYLRELYIKAHEFNFMYCSKESASVFDSLKTRVVIFDGGRNYENHGRDIKSRVNFIGVYNPRVFYCNFTDQENGPIADHYLDEVTKLNDIIRGIDDKMNGKNKSYYG
jgi:hypothetical protein